MLYPIKLRDHFPCKYREYLFNNLILGIFNVFEWHGIILQQAIGYFLPVLATGYRLLIELALNDRLLITQYRFFGFAQEHNEYRLQICLQVTVLPTLM
jgi:hypothetical protein